MCTYVSKYVCIYVCTSLNLVAKKEAESQKSQEKYKKRKPKGQIENTRSDARTMSEYIRTWNQFQQIPFSDWDWTEFPLRTISKKLRTVLKNVAAK